MTKSKIVDDELQRKPDHPDLHEINDWLLNGPKNGRIEGLVRELTLGHGLRLAEVEDLMLKALLNKKHAM